jgi:3-isopropylmalate/(R)-2-methylmalate dehydratase small subunit
VDLEACTIRHDPHRDAETFSVDPNARDMLLQGLDEIGLTEQSSDEITAFEKRDQKRRPWVYLGTD